MPNESATTEQQAQQTGQQTAQNAPGQQSTTQQTTSQPQGQQTTQQQTTQQDGRQRTDAGQNNGETAQQRGLIADLQKERQARQRLENQIATLTSAVEAEKRRVQALAGVTPQSEEDTQIEEVKARLVKMFPVLGRLSEKELDSVLSLNQRAGAIEATAQHHWQTHGRSMLDSLQKAVATEIGVDLTDRQKKALGRAYVAEAEADPEFLKRHEEGDKTLIDEFAKGWIEDWFEPARKTVVTTEAQRFRRVPNGRDRNVQTTPPKAVDFKNPKAVEDAMVESFKSHGGRFDN